MDLDEIKSRINPQYADCIGTESYERKWLCDRIDELAEQRDLAMADARYFEKQRDELADTVGRCYKMLLSEPDTKGALFRAENILREALAIMREPK